MQQDRSSGYACSRIPDVESAMSARDERDDGIRENPEEPARHRRPTLSLVNHSRSGAVRRLLARTAEHPATGSSCAAPEPARSVHPEFRTQVAVSGAMVTGVLSGTAGPAPDAIAVSGDVQRLSCEQALELADALMLIVLRIDAVTQARESASATATDRGEGWAMRSPPVAQRSAATERA
jgi:hypothetical protein